MRRLSRHTVVVLLVALVSCIGGMSLAVVAFGQAGGDPDSGVPTGDFTGTTPAQTATAAQTTTLGGYGSTTPTTVTAPSTTPTTSTSTSTSTSSTPTSGQSTPSGSHSATSHAGSAVSRTSVKAPLPSKATRSGPTRLAFTGGQPIVVGLAGIGLMLAGLGLGLRRWRAATLQLP